MKWIALSKNGDANPMRMGTRWPVGVRLGETQQLETLKTPQAQSDAAAFPIPGGGGGMSISIKAESALPECRAFVYHFAA